MSDSCPEWILEIQNTVGCVNNNIGKAGSICRVSEKIREAEDKDKDRGSYNYRPKCVAIGPIHRGTRSDLQIMEETKWRSMHKLLSRPTESLLKRETVKICSEFIRRMESVIRASYGENIEMASEELARNMLLDACFLLELLLRLSESNDPETETDPSDLYNINDKKKMVRVLTDLTLLENQIPFVLLSSLSSKLLKRPLGAAQQELATLLELCPDKRLSPRILAESLFAGAGADFSTGVYHFLHLIHLCSPDPYPQQYKHSKAPLQLLRCARKLQAFGITIKAQTNHYIGNNETGILASALTEFVDKFEFEIKFNKRKRELIIPTLHIKEATEVKWRNLIAWEQLGLIGIGYKFSSYAYFFKSLVSSVHDIQLLKKKGVISVHKEAKDEDLVIMFQSIVSGEEQMDDRYRGECERLNKVKVNGVVGCCVLIFTMLWYYWLRFLEWLQHRLISVLQAYFGTVWTLTGVVVGAAMLGLSITQTIYAIRAVK